MSRKSSSYVVSVGVGSILFKIFVGVIFGVAPDEIVLIESHVGSVLFRTFVSISGLLSRLQSVTGDGGGLESAGKKIGIKIAY